jgi:polysaccharide pyruvyl transferase WcaK-like protein
MSEPKRIAIIGGTIWGNRGAESMLVTTIYRIRTSFPDAKFFIFSYYPKKDRELVSDPSVEILDGRPLTLGLKHMPLSILFSLLKAFSLTRKWKVLNSSLRKLLDCDVLLDIGGITFSDGRELFLLYNICSIWPAMLLKVPVFKLAQAIGPFHNPLNRVASQLFLPRCQHIFARGRYTAQHLTSIKLGTDKWSRAADIAFIYDPAASLSSENEEEILIICKGLHQLRSIDKQIVVISPSSLVMKKSTKQGYDYLGVFLKIIRSAPKNIHFVLLPNATKASSNKARNNDILAIQSLQDRVLAELPQEYAARITAIDFDLNTSGIRKIISHANLNLTSRFHSMVSSIALCVPTLVIGWSHKYEEIMLDFGCEQFTMDFSAIEENIDSKLPEMLAQEEAIRAQIAEHLPTVRQLAESQFDYLKQALI